ncbi:MAG: beta-propeller fold lactonase family protein [Terriglobales bacterium]
MNANSRRTTQFGVFLLLALMLGGCGGGGTTTCGIECVQSTSEFLYTASINQVQALPVNASAGTLGAPSGVAGPNGGDGIVATPSAKFLYVSDAQNDAIDTFSIDASSGALTPVGSPTPIGTSPGGGGGLAMDPAGMFLYATDLGASDVVAFAINSSTGALTQVGSPLATGAIPAGAGVDPSGKFLYVSNTEDPNGGISAYTIDSASGALAPISGSPFPVQVGTFPGPVDFAFHPNGKFLYVSLLGSTSYNEYVAAFAIDPTSGALTAVSGSPFLTGIGPLGIAVNPAGTFLFTANDGDGTVSAFNIDGTSGVLTSVSGSPFPGGTNLSGLAMAPSGNFLYTTNPLSNSIITLSISSTGSLSFVGQPVVAGQQPHVLTVVKIP